MISWSLADNVPLHTASDEHDWNARHINAFA
jgi:hypothetical protein